MPARWVDRFIQRREKKPFHIYGFLAIVTFVGSARFLLELTLCKSIIPRSIFQLPNQWSFYLCISLLFALGTAALARVEWQKCLNVVTLGVFVGCFPPLIDTLIFGPYQCFYAYNADGLRGWPWLLYSPERNVDVGEATALWAAIFLLAMYVQRRSRSWLRTAVALAWGYGTVFFCSTVLGTTVRWLAAHNVPRHLGADPPVAAAPTLMATAEVMVSLGCYLAFNRKLAARIARRSIHGAPFAALTFLGATHTAWVLARDGKTAPLDLSATVLPLIWLAFAVVASIVQNDYFDQKEDSSRAACPDVSLTDVRFVTFCSALVTFAALNSVARAGMALLLLNLTALVYNADFYRGKRLFPTNYKIEATWGAGAYLLGVFIMTIGIPRPSADLWWGTALVFGGWSIFSSIKDYKDLLADRRARNQTLYILLWRRGVSIRALHRHLRLGLTLAMLVPPALLHLSGLHSIALWCLTLPCAAFTFWALGLGPKPRTVYLGFLGVTLYIVALAIALI